MKGGKKPLGYTIVELMIVLAVSGVLFVIATNFISGKQGRTQFNQGSNELASRLQSIIEEVTDGQYTDIPFTCQVTGSILSINGAVSPSQGTNPDCVFVGKLIHFSVGGDQSKYEIFSLAGARSTGGTTPDFSNSLIRPIDDSDAPSAPPINLTKQANIPQNLSITNTNISGSCPGSSYGIGFMQGLGTSDASSNTFQTGAQNISLVCADLSGTMDETAAVNYLKTPGSIDYAKSATICVSDGTRTATINLGVGNDSNLSVSVKQLGEGGTPACPLT